MVCALRSGGSGMSLLAKLYESHFHTTWKNEHCFCVKRDCFVDYCFISTFMLYKYKNNDAE